VQQVSPVTVVGNRIAVLLTLLFTFVTGISHAIPAHARLPLHHIAAGGTMACSKKLISPFVFRKKTTAECGA
jgi:hypothetical protein